MPDPLAFPCRIAVIWIDWYPYHVARFRGLESNPTLQGRCVGLELVGGIGVHAGLKFREDIPDDLRIETLQPDVSWRDAGKLKLALDLWERLSQLKPSVVLVPGYYTLPAIAAALWARVHGATSVLMTESTACDHKRVGWKELLKAVGMRALFDWAVAGGKSHVDYLRQLHFPEARITGSYDVVDNAMFRQGTLLLREQSRLRKFPYFLYVGRLAPEKNIATLLASWVVYRKKGGTWPLMLVGDGPSAAALKVTAAASGFGTAVLFPGLKSSRELLPYYACAGAFVLPSTREPWGLVVNEAMASGLPVLVSDRCGCAADLVSEGSNGFVFNPQDPAALSALLLRMESMTVEQRALMGASSQEIISLYSPERFGRSIAFIADSVDPTSALQPVAGGTR